MKVMIVDDDDGVRETVSILLEDSPYNITCVESGEECLDLLKKGFRGIILMDIMMPDLDGWDTVTRMKQLGLLEGNIICMFTASMHPGEKGKVLADSIIEYITKPFSEEELLNKLKHCSDLLGARSP